MSQFVENLMDDGYGSMAADNKREAEAMEWCESLVNDILDETDYHECTRP